VPRADQDRPCGLHRHRHRDRRRQQGTWSRESGHGSERYGVAVFPTARFVDFSGGPEPGRLAPAGNTVWLNTVTGSGLADLALAAGVGRGNCFTRKPCSNAPHRAICEADVRRTELHGRRARLLLSSPAPCDVMCEETDAPPADRRPYTSMPAPPAQPSIAVGLGGAGAGTSSTSSIRSLPARQARARARRDPHRERDPVDPDHVRLQADHEHGRECARRATPPAPQTREDARFQRTNASTPATPASTPSSVYVDSPARISTPVRLATTPALPEAVPLGCSITTRTPSRRFRQWLSVDGLVVRERVDRSCRPAAARSAEELELLGV
jgi:hypothetical protein